MGTTYNFFNMDTAMVIAMIVSVIIPLCSNILAREHWPSEVVGILTALLATANGFFSEWAGAGSNFKWQSALSMAVLSFFLAVAAHYGLWKGTKTEKALLRAPKLKNGAHRVTTLTGKDGNRVG